MCSGPLATDCLECIAGYYLDTSDYSCTSCATGCKECINQMTCTRCQDGYYRFTDIQDGFPVTKCFAQSCPTGTLPFLVSIYYLNPSMFSDSELEQKLVTSEEATVTQESNTSYAIAIDA